MEGPMRILVMTLAALLLGCVLGWGYGKIEAYLDEQQAAKRYRQEQIDKQLQRRHSRREGLASEFQRYKECVQGGERPSVCLEN